MSRRKIIIITGIVAAGLILTAIAIVLNLNNQPEPETNRQPDTTSEPHIHEGDMHEIEYEVPIDIAGDELKTEEIVSSLVPKAEKAAIEYVKQSTRETSVQRADRLRKVFAETSPAIYAAKPAVDKTRSSSSSSSAKVVDSSWSLEGNRLVVTVFLEITTKNTDNPPKVISQLYQGYDITMTQTETGYQANEIIFSNKPLVLRRD